MHDVDQLGYPKPILKRDKELAILHLQTKVVVSLKERGIDCIPENSMVSESKGNGDIERPIQDGRTAYERLKQMPFRKSMVPIGESLHYQLMGRAKANYTQKLNKLSNKWRDGIYL